MELSPSHAPSSPPELEMQALRYQALMDLLGAAGKRPLEFRFIRVMLVTAGMQVCTVVVSCELGLGKARYQLKGQLPRGFATPDSFFQALQLGFDRLTPCSLWAA